MGEEFISAMGELSSEAFAVKGLRIDDLLPQMDNRVDFMKVDVEGAEPLVFEGAQRTIAANPYLIIVAEWSPGQIKAAGFEISAFLSSLEAMGLRSYDIADDRLVHVPFEDLMNIPYRTGIVLTRSV